MEWQDICSAPKDGSAILCVWFGSDGEQRQSVAEWLDSSSFPHWQPTDAPFMHILHPTHWLPLPKPPMNDGEKGSDDLR